MALMWILCILVNMGVGADGVLCYWCSGVGADRECERHPYAVRTGPIYINCRSRFCITAKVTDAHTGEVQSFARLCDNLPHGNQCVRDARLLTCYESCTHDLCNNGNPGPHYLKTVNYASHSRSNTENNAINFISNQGARNNGMNKKGDDTDTSKVENMTFVDGLRLDGRRRGPFVRNNRIVNGNEGDVDVRDRDLKMKEKFASSWFLTDSVGSQGHTTLPGEEKSRAVVSGSRQDERGSSSTASQKKPSLQGLRPEGIAKHRLSNYVESPYKKLSSVASYYNGKKDEVSYGFVRKTETKLTSVESSPPPPSLGEQRENLGAILDFEKRNFRSNKGEKEGNYVLFKKRGTLKENLYKPNRNPFEEREEWGQSPSERRAPLLQTYSTDRQTAPMVTDKHPSADLSSQKLQDKAQITRDVLVGDLSASSPRSSPDSYLATTTRGPFTFSAKKLGRSFQSKSDRFYLPSFLGAGTGNEDVSSRHIKTRPEVSTPPSYSAHWSPDQTFHPSLSSPIYVREKLAPMFRVLNPVRQSRPTVLLASAPEQVSVLVDPRSASLLPPATTAHYGNHPSPIQLPYSRIPWHQQVSTKKNSPSSQRASQSPKSNPSFPVLVSAHNGSSLSSPLGVSHPKIDSYYVFQNKLHERDFRFVPGDESQSSDLWEPQDPDIAYVETGYKMDSLDDIVSAYRQHPGNRYSTSQPVIYAPPTLQTTATSSFEEAKRKTPSSLKKLTQTDFSSPTAVTDQSASLSTINDDERSPSLTTTSFSPIVVNSDEKSVLSSALADQGSSTQTAKTDKRSLSSFEGLDEVLSLPTAENDHQSPPLITVNEKLSSLSTAKNDQQSFLSITTTNQVLSLPTSKNDQKSFSLTTPTNQAASLSSAKNDQRSPSQSASTDNIFPLRTTTGIPDRLLAEDSPRGTAARALPQEKSTSPERLHSLLAAGDGTEVSNYFWSEFGNTAEDLSDNAAFKKFSSAASDFLLNSTGEDNTTQSFVTSQPHANLTSSFILVAINVSSGLHANLLPGGKEEHLSKFYGAEIASTISPKEKLTKSDQNANKIAPMDAKTIVGEENNSVYASISDNSTGKERPSTSETSKSSGRHKTNGIIPTGVNKTSENPLVSTSDISDEVANRSIQTVYEVALSSPQMVPSETTITVSRSLSSKASQDGKASKTLTTKQYSNSVTSHSAVIQLDSFVTTRATPMSHRQQETKPSPMIPAAPYYQPTERRPLLLEPQHLQNNGKSDGKYTGSPYSRRGKVELGSAASGQEVDPNKVDPNKRAVPQLHSSVAESPTKTSTSPAVESRRVAVEELSRQGAEYKGDSQISPSSSYVNKATSEFLQKTDLDTVWALTTFLGTTRSPLSQQTTSRFQAAHLGVGTVPVTSAIDTLTIPSPVRKASKMTAGKMQAAGMVSSSETQERSRWGHVHSEAKGRSKSTRASPGLVLFVLVVLAFVFSR